MNTLFTTKLSITRRALNKVLRELHKIHLDENDEYVKEIINYAADIFDLALKTKDPDNDWIEYFKNAACSDFEVAIAIHDSCVKSNINGYRMNFEEKREYLETVSVFLSIIAFRNPFYDLYKESISVGIPLMLPDNLESIFKTIIPIDNLWSDDDETLRTTTFVYKGWKFNVDTFNNVDAILDLIDYMILYNTNKDNMDFEARTMPMLLTLDDIIEANFEPPTPVMMAARMNLDIYSITKYNPTEWDKQILNSIYGSNC